MKTRTFINTSKMISRDWHIVDAKDQVLGRVAPIIAKYLMGKHKPTYTPNIDNGDHVVVINARQVVVTGNKAKKKIYYNHSGIPGGLRERTFEEVMEKSPTEIFRHAVHGMIPKNKMSDPRLNRLHVFAGGEHEYADKFTGVKAEKKSAKG